MLSRKYLLNDYILSGWDKSICQIEWISIQNPFPSGVYAYDVGTRRVKGTCPRLPCGFDSHVDPTQKWDLSLTNQMQGCEFWKTEVQGQASVASAASVASLVVRYLVFLQPHWWRAQCWPLVLWGSRGMALGIHSVDTDYSWHHMSLHGRSSLEPKLLFHRRSEKK